MIKEGLVLQNRYEVVKELGKGGFGQTWKVDDAGTPKVLKVLIFPKVDYGSYLKAVELFQREAEVLSQLNDPGIPRVDPDCYFIFQPEGATDPLHCLVMELIEGKNLKTWLKEDRSNQPIAQAEALVWLKQLVGILAQVHEQKYFHRDIKPENIMRRPDGQLALIDFGTAREETTTYLTKLGRAEVTQIRSKYYTPPEQANGKAVQKSDFFALGRTFVYLLTGKPLQEFFEENPNIFKPKKNWRTSAPDEVSRSPLADLIDDLMAPDPENRPKDAQEILQRLEIISIESSILSTVPRIRPIIKSYVQGILKDELRRWAKQSRIPKIALYGRAGSGKSSLVNAIMGEQVAPTRVDRAATLQPMSYTCDRKGRKLEVVDSRGVGETAEYDPAFAQAIQYIVQEKVDIVLFVIPAKERAFVDNDVRFLTALQQQHNLSHETKLPIILVMNQIDIIDPPYEWSPPYELSLDSEAAREPATKREKKEANILKCIRARGEEYKNLTSTYVPVCAYWDEYEDRTYKIDELEIQIYNCIHDDAAKQGFGGVTAGLSLKRAVAGRCKLTAAWFAFGTGWIPNVVLFVQNLLVKMIAKIADPEQEQSITAEEFLQKLGVEPTDAKSSVAMTLAIGEAAIRYFIEGSSLEKAREVFALEEERQETELQRAERPEDVMRILQEIDRELCERYGLSRMYDDNDIDPIGRNPMGLG